MFNISQISVILDKRSPWSVQVHSSSREDWVPHLFWADSESFLQTVISLEKEQAGEGSGPSPHPTCIYQEKLRYCQIKWLKAWQLWCLETLIPVPRVWVKKPPIFLCLSTHPSHCISVPSSYLQWCSCFWSHTVNQVIETIQTKDNLVCVWKRSERSLQL